MKRIQVCIGVGPQVEFIFPVAGMQGYLNLKAYAEFDNANRPDGWNVWVTFVLSPAPAGARSGRAANGDESVAVQLMARPADGI